VVTVEQLRLFDVETTTSLLDLWRLLQDVTT